MKTLCQSDPRWSLHKIRGTYLTLARWGCTITAICMIHSKFYRNHIWPHQGASEWLFGTRGRLYGLIFWTSSIFTGMEFVGRFKGYNEQRIKEYSGDPNKGVILQVDKYHWVAVGDKRLGLRRYFDPIDGRVLYRLTGRGGRYRKVTGYAIFRKK